MLLAADDNFVQGNLIGTNSSGTADVGNTLDGVILLDGASGNTVGGTASGAGNVISGNDGDGVGITEFLTSGNLVQGNLIGTDITGAVVMPNGGSGVSLSDGALTNVIGGIAPGAGNVISGNIGEGVRIANPDTQGNQVQGNLIGTNADDAMLGNGSHGILAIGSGANEIGGSEAGAGNTIAFNGGDGIAVVFAESFSFFKFIRQNSTFQNVGLGIDLEDDGVTLNDPGDTDIGANDLYNFPVFETVSLGGGELTLTGFARPDAQIELFIADPDPTGFGEGKIYLTTLVEGSAADSDSGTGTYGPGPVNGLIQGTDTTNRFSFTVPIGGLPAAVSAGTVLTATGADGINTSEFSGNVTVAGPTAMFDFGDAPTQLQLPTLPNDYPTLLVDDGARHAIVTGSAFIGVTPPDIDNDGQPEVDALGDDNDGSDDEDLTDATVLRLEVTPGEQDAYFSLWVDFDRDGSWESPLDRDLVVEDLLVPAGSQPGEIEVPLMLPADATPGATFARARISTQQGLPSFGPAPDGEVEDFAVNIMLPALTATKTDQLVSDANNSGTANPGDVIGYTVEIRNQGEIDLTSVQFNDTLDPNTMLVAGSVQVTPLALDDTYQIAKTVTSLVIDADGGLLANDFDIDGTSPGTNVDLEVVVSSLARTGGDVTGSLSVDEDGSFTYTPPAGERGSETFSYNIVDDDGLGALVPGFITFNVGSNIWFIDNSLATNGDGSLSNPFNSFTEVNGTDGVGDVDEPGDIIFVFEGSSEYDGEIELEDGQQLIGEGSGLTVGNTELVPAGNPPQLINPSVGLGDDFFTSGHVVNLANSNVIRGVNIDASNAIGVFGPDVDGGLIENVTISGLGTLTEDLGSLGILIINGVGDFTIRNSTVSNDGIAVTVSGDGDFTFDGVDIDTAGAALGLLSGAGDVQFTGGSTITSTGVGIEVFFDGTLVFDNTTTIMVSGPGSGGIQFDGAGGTADFQGVINLTDVETGISVIGGSTGTYTFGADTTITNASGEAIQIGALSELDDPLVRTGGSADIVYHGTIMQTVAAPTIEAYEHDGSLTFNGSITATSGEGLFFGDADGIYTFNGPVMLSGGDAGIEITLDGGLDLPGDGSDGTFVFEEVTISGSTGTPVSIDGETDGQSAQVTFNNLAIDQSVGDGVFANHSGSLTIDFGDIDNTTGDGIHVTNTNLLVNFTQIGLDVGIGDDGIEVVNNDGFDRMATITSNNIFELGRSNGIANRGIFINSSGTGTLEADVRFNQINSTNQTILTTSGPTPGSLILDLQNSTLSTDTPGVLTEEHVGSGLHSTIVRSWVSPNQVIGSVISGMAGGGILFDQVTFDADADPGNGFQQVQFPGTLDIGSVPPLTIARVTGDGLSFINPTGDLSIETLNIANFNGTGLNVDATGTDFSFTTNGGTIDTLGGLGIQATNINRAAISNLQVTGGDGFDGVEVILNEAGLMSSITALDNTWTAQRQRKRRDDQHRRHRRVVPACGRQ